MSITTQPTKAQFKSALNELFAFKTLRERHQIDIGDAEIEKYAEIGVFLCDAVAVADAMEHVSRWMLDLFATSPETYAHTDGDDFTRRSASQRDDMARSKPSEDGLPKKNKAQIMRKRTENFETSRGNMLGAFDSKQTEMSKLMQHPEFGSGLVDRGGVIVRRFKFRKLLEALEAKKLSLTDDGDVYTTDIKIADVLRQGKVWKDSIGFDHGEYTHRLQWLAIAAHFDWSKETLLLLYRGTSASLKLAIYGDKGFNFGSIDGIPDAGEAIALPVNVWSMLFDSRESRGRATKCWPVEPAVQDSKAPHEFYRHAARSNTCRSPVVLNRMLKGDARFGLIHAYLAASSLKLLQPHHDRINANAQQSISSYRNDRIASKQGGGQGSAPLLVFETPFSPLNETL